MNILKNTMNLIMIIFYIFFIYTFDIDFLKATKLLLYAMCFIVKRRGPVCIFS